MSHETIEDSGPDSARAGPREILAADPQTPARSTTPPSAGKRKDRPPTGQKLPKRKLPPEGDPARYVFYSPPPCPGCGSTARHLIDATRDGYRIAQCQTCGARFILVPE